MSTFKKYKIGEDHKVVLDLGSHLSSDHLCKKIEKIVSELDTKKIESNYSPKGQNALHPKLMLSVIFYGYTQGIRSGRKLATACEESLPFIYLSKGYYPKKSAINDFRKNNYTYFSDLFIQVLHKCIDEDLVNLSPSIVDGSKLESDSAKRQTKTKEKYEKWQSHLLEDIASLEATLKDSLDLTSNQSTPSIEKKKIKQLSAQKRLVSKIEYAIKQIEQDESLEKLNLTDPDAPLMKGKKGNYDTNYNVQIACGEDQFITHCDVVIDGNDKHQLIPMIEGIIKNTSKPIKSIIADSGYGTYDSLEFLDENNIIGYMPYKDMNTDFSDQPFHTQNFIYNEDQDYYICPANRQLKFYRTSERKERRQHFKHYRADELKTCKHCPFRAECAPKGAARRIIQRETRQHLKDEMKQRLNSEQGREIYRKRLHPVESFFGHIKHNLRYTRFSLRGLEKVKAEFTLICLTYNLMKLITRLNHFFIHILNCEPSIWMKKCNSIVIPNLSMNFVKHIIKKHHTFKYDNFYYCVCFLNSRSAWQAMQ